jgi:anti-sigma B factor antagonist
VGMEVAELNDKITKVTLNGRLDTPGVDRIETRFVATLVPAGKNAIVDFSGVEFVASMGIRMLISVARGMRQRQAKLAIYNVPSLVQDTFQSVSLSDRHYSHWQRRKRRPSPRLLVGASPHLSARWKAMTS